jgi:glycerophosphoryl diester phosphodiesterase
VRLEIQAHRANSSAALRTLLAARPSSLEIDVGVTRDGAVVVSHEVRATTLECRPSPLLGRPWNELSAGKARGLGRLTLDEALAVAGETPVLVEAKSDVPHTVSPKEFARALEPYLHRVGVSSFDKRVLTHARRLHRPLETTFLFEVPVRVATAAKTLGPRADLVTRDLVHAAHALGMRIVPWTVNDPKQMHALIELGVDGIVTDDPALLAEVATQAATPLRRAA